MLIFIGNKSPSYIQLKTVKKTVLNKSFATKILLKRQEQCIKLANFSYYICVLLFLALSVIIIWFLSQNKKQKSLLFSANVSVASALSLSGHLQYNRWYLLWAAEQVGGEGLYS